MDENKALQEYSKRFINDGYQLDDWQMNVIKNSFGFRSHILRLAFIELKESILNVFRKRTK